MTSPNPQRQWPDGWPEKFKTRNDDPTKDFGMYTYSRAVEDCETALTDMEIIPKGLLTEEALLKAVFAPCETNDNVARIRNLRVYLGLEGGKG